MNRRTALLMGLGLLAVLLFWYAALWSPVQSSLADANDRQDRAELEARTLRLQSTHKDDNSAEVAKAAEREAVAEAAKALVPDQADLDGVINQLSSAASDAGLVLQSISASPPAKLTSADPPTIPVSLQVLGSFTGLQHYLTTLEQLPRLFVVDGVSVSSAEAQGAPTLTVTITGRAFAIQLPPDQKTAK
jgi:Tfp pilus assembly protein PilO